jgi:ketosteroid isomerase-like protein
MSQENVEIVRRGYETFNRTHKPVREMLHPEVEWHTAEDLPDSGTHRGIDGVEKLFAEWSDSFEGFRGDIDEIIDGGDEVVVVVVELRGRIKGSSQEVVLPETHVWKLREGKAFEIREYRTKAQALEAAGLSEP